MIDTTSFIHKFNVDNFQEIKKLLLQEYAKNSNNQVPYKDGEGDDYHWFVIRKKDLVSDYCDKLTDEYREKLDLTGDVNGRFYRLIKNSGLQFHIDEGTACSINFILNDSYVPIKFKHHLEDNNEIEVKYNCALLNTQKLHSVNNIKEDRIIFKISIFDHTFKEVKEKIVKNYE